MRTRALTAAVALTALTGCGTASTGASPRTTGSTTPAGTPSAGEDRACRSSVPFHESDQVATAVLKGGDGLVVSTAGYPATSTGTLHAFTADCRPDPAFGEDGVATLTWADDTVVYDVTPTSDGGALLIGEAGDRWSLARVDAHGALDPGFGKGGWTVLPWKGRTEAAAEAPDGSVVIGGTEGGGCCVVSYVGRLDAHGDIVRAFGTDGRTKATNEHGDSGVSKVGVLADGTLLVMAGGGNMGCYGETVSAYSAEGVPVPGFLTAFKAAWDVSASPDAESFVGDLVVETDGFKVVGVRQHGCVGEAPGTDAHGVVASFRADGTLVKQTTFPAKMGDSATALPQADGSLLVGVSPLSYQADDSTPAVLHLVTLGATGAVDSVDDRTLPYKGSSGPGVRLATDGQHNLLVSSGAEATALEVRDLVS